jgi:putative copper resistance protein D
MLEAALLIGRFLQFAAASLLFGAPLFLLYGPSIAPTGTVRRLLIGAAVAAIAASLILLAAQTGEMTGNAADAFDPATAWVVASDTHFGAVWSIRSALIVCSLIALSMLAPGRLLWVSQSLLGGLMLASLAFTGHGGMGEGGLGQIHLVADSLHLLAAGVWLGALPLLLLLIVGAQRDPNANQAALIGLVRFSAIGPVVVSVLVLSGLINAWVLIGPERALEALGQAYGQAYGQVLAIKLVLVAAMLGFAAWNRWKLTPLLRAAIAGSSEQTALRRLRLSVGAETALALLVLALVALLGTLEPPMAGG